MNKKIIILVSVIVGSLLLINFAGKKQQTQLNNLAKAQPTTEQDINKNVDETIEPADSIEVVNFFATQRCASCLTIGQFTKKTLEEKFAPELESGKIVFKEINGELPENKEVVTKYQARGSSLFINAIRGEQESIAEDVTVWKLVNSEEQFSSYLETKLNRLLGK